MLDLALDDRIFLNDPIDCAVQELDLILNTNCTELIGYTEYGTNFEQFLWEMAPSTEEVKNYIRIKLWNTYFLKNYRTGFSGITLTSKDNQMTIN